MKKILTLVLLLTVSLALSGCDFLDPDLIDQIKEVAGDYCEENPDNEYCNLDFEEELEKAEMKLKSYFEDYSNNEYTNQEIADMYFDGMIPEGFEEERTADLEAGTVLSLDSLSFRLDGGFDISYAATTGDDIILRKRPGRVHYDVELETSAIVWYDGIDNDCDDDCDSLEDMDATKETITKYFEDYANAEISHQEIADMYYGGVLLDEFALQRDKDLVDGIVLTLLEVLERVDDDYFEITYEESRQGSDIVVRKRPGRTTYKTGSSLIIWDNRDNDCDGVDDDCN
jgi:hypothetical protein